jgi:metallo-beta-lactamase class B
MMKALLALLIPGVLSAQNRDTIANPCAQCATWNAPQQPTRLFGNTYYVGTHGLSAILVYSPTGSILIDGALPESTTQIVANIRALGFLAEDVRVIGNSHVHFDHAGGLAALQRATGAVVVASPKSAPVLASGQSGRDDPQYGVIESFEPVKNVRVLKDGETVKAGTVSATAHFTAGHTPGGTSWSWVSCEGSRCLTFVYADSQTPVSADGFLFTKSETYPSGVADFRHGFSVLEALPCDVLITPHPGASNLWERIAAQDSGRVDALVDTGACKRYAATARKALEARITKEATAK